MKKLYWLLLGILLLPSLSSAHPGNTAADGCHYCRTNCDKWGVAWNERHCHGGSTPAPTSTYTAPVVTPTKTITPAVTKTVKTTITKLVNTYGSGKIVTCTGSIVSTTGTSCLIPASTKTVVKKLVCKKGYVLSKTGKSCVKKK